MNIENEIYVLQDDTKYILVYTEAPKTSIEQVNTYFDYLAKITKSKKFNLIIDLSKTSLPSAEVRSCLKNNFGKLEHSISSYSIIIGNNVLLKIAVKFVGASIGLRNFKTFKSVKMAQNKLNENS